jgi:hypothetical protein
MSMPLETQAPLVIVSFTLPSPASGDRLSSMKIEKIREVLHAQPFRPFWIHLADGGRLRVEHEDFVALAPSGRELIVFQRDDSHQVVDVMLVTRLEVKAGNGAGLKKKPSTRT